MLYLLTMTAVAQTAPLRPEPVPRAESPRARLWQEPSGPLAEGRYAMPVAGNLQLGVGRYRVAEPPRPRTHTEPIMRSGTDLSRRDRGIAAVGLSLRF